jgi:hypothetical protein
MLYVSNGAKNEEPQLQIKAATIFCREGEKK